MRCYGELFGVGTWELFAFTHPLSPPAPQTKKEKLAWTVECPLSNWKVNSGQSNLHTKYNLKKEKPSLCTHPKEKKGGPLTPRDKFSLFAWKVYSKNWLLLFLARLITLPNNTLPIEWVPTIAGSNRPPSPETPTRLTNGCHLTSKTGCTSAKKF